MKSIPRFLFALLLLSATIARSAEPPAAAPANLPPKVAQAAAAESQRYEERRAHLHRNDPAVKAAMENITVVSMENQNRMDEAQITAEELTLTRLEATDPTLAEFVAQKRAVVAQRRAGMMERVAAVKKLKAPKP